jgi:hypothetical protein
LTPTGQATSRSGQFNVSSSIAAIAANYPADLDSISYNDLAMLAAFMAGLPLLQQFNMLDCLIYNALEAYFDLLIALSTPRNSVESQERAGLAKLDRCISG